MKIRARVLLRIGVLLASAARRLQAGDRHAPRHAPAATAEATPEATSEVTFGAATFQLAQCADSGLCTDQDGYEYQCDGSGTCTDRTAFSTRATRPQLPGCAPVPDAPSAAPAETVRRSPC